MASRATLLLFALLVAVTAQCAHGFLVRVEVRGPPVRCPPGNAGSGVIVNPTGTPLVNANVTVAIIVGNIQRVANTTTRADGSISVTLDLNVLLPILPNTVSGVAVVNVNRNACGSPNPAVITAPLITLGGIVGLITRLVPGFYVYVGSVSV